MPNSPNLNLVMMSASQAQKEVVFNNFLIAMDALYKGSVIDVTLNTPPASPNPGDAYIVAPGGTGVWSGADNKVAVYFSGWQFFGPSVGQLIWSVAESAYYVYKNSTLGWITTPTVAITTFADLTDVSVSTPTNGMIPIFNSTTSKWTQGFLTLAELGDVEVTEGSGINGYVLGWNNATAKWEAVQLAAVATSGAYSSLSGLPTIPTNGSFLLSGLGDVAISGTPTTSYVLTWNGTHWAPAAGNGGAVAIQNNGSTITAAASTLNFVNATSVTNSSGDVTITLSTGGGGGGGGTGLLPPYYEMGPLAPPNPIWFDMSGSGSTTVMNSIANVGTQITSPAASGDHVCFGRRMATGWTAPWSVTSRIVPSDNMAVEYAGVGMFVEDSAGKIQGIMAQGAVGSLVKLQLLEFTNNTTYDSTPYSDQMVDIPEWFQVSYDGTNLVFGASNDGINWSTLSVVATSYLANVTYVGIGGDNNYSSGPAFVPAAWSVLCTYYADPDHPASDHEALTSATIEDLYDVSVTSPTNGQVLAWNSGAGKWENANAGSNTLAGDSDVSITSPTNGQVLVYNSGAAKWENTTLGGSSTLASDTDVKITSPTNGQVLAYNATASKWENQAPSSGGFVIGTPPTVVQFNYVSVNGVGPSVTMSSAPVNGNLLVAIVYTSGAHPGAASGWTLQSEATTGLWYCQVYTKIAGASETTTQLPYTGGSSSYWSIGIWEVNGQNASPILAASAAYNAGSSNSVNTPVIPQTTSTLYLASVAPANNQSETLTYVFGIANIDINLTSGAGAHAAFGWCDSNNPTYGMFGALSTASTTNNAFALITA